MSDWLALVICKYDVFLLLKVTAILDWLHEWLSISQKAVERTLICIYGLGSAILVEESFIHKTPIPPWIVCVGQSSLIAIMLAYHSDASVIRVIKHLNLRSALMRCVWQYLVIIVCLPPYENLLMECGLLIADVSFMIFLLVVACNCTGKRGRRRKVAWDKLKELFSWLPDPVPGRA